MARWEPDAQGRLLRAALELFSERGYEATTAAQIAQRAGLTRATLFRHFADKREVLFQGQPATVALVEAQVRAAPAGATAEATLRDTLSAMSEAHVPEQQQIGRQIEKLVAANPELYERATLKRATIASALEQALASRFEDPHLAGVLADLGVRAYYDGFGQWIVADRETKLTVLVSDRLDALLAVLPGIIRDG